jgi:hypothetical protein
MKLLDEILSDYPRIWEFYRNDLQEKARGPKFSQRYPLPIGTLSMVMDFHKWTYKTTNIVAEELGQVFANEVRKTGIGPCPTIMSRLLWINSQWSNIERKRKSLARTLGDEILHWHTRIRVKVNDGDIYTYDSAMLCQQCAHASVVRMNDSFVCVNIECRDPLTGAWRKW